jgi:protein-S-isoprenylcysteine O-methyltransferase Ste14
VSVDLKHPWNIVFLAGFIVYVAIRHSYAARVRNVETKVRRIDGLEMGLMAAVMLGSLLLPVLYLFTPLLRFADYRLPTFSPWVGVLMMVFALWLFRRSHVDLGRQWSISLEVREDHRLITNGVYRTIRHPMYLSIWILSLAQGLMLENWLAGWAALVAFASMYFLRTPREEALMLETFGDEYRAYTNRSGRIFPRIGKSTTN